MEFRIADTFTASLARLASAEQKAAKTTAFDLQMDPSAPGMKFHRIEKSRDPNFWSVRASGDLRIIVHKTAASFLFAYVGHHDDAYAWAERRKIEAHPRTGAAQWVEIVERQEPAGAAAPIATAGPSAAAPSRQPFTHISTDELLAYGVPTDWIEAVQAADEDSLFNLAQHLPAEAMDALLELATGGKPKPAEPLPPDADPFAHPDAQRRFRVVANLD